MYASNYITTHLKKAKLRSGGDYWDACCDIHEDARESLSIDAKTGRCTCHGCGWGGWLDEYAEAARLPEPPPKDGAPEKKKDNKKRERSAVVAEYVYTDGNGAPHMKVVRTAAKEFFQYRWGGLRWISGLKGADGTIDRLPYNLQRIMETQANQFIIWVEGEKDADRLNAAGLLATTSPGGAKAAGKLSRWDMFRGRTVYALPDNDEAGRGYVKAVGNSLLEAEAAVKICELPGLPPKGDVSDWLKNHSIDELKAALLKNSVDYGIETAKPDIQVDWRDVREVADEVLTHLLGGELYNRGGELVHLVRRNGETAPHLRPLDKDGLLAYLCRHMTFHTKVKSGTKSVAPPGWLANLIMDSIEEFPTCRRVTEFPFVTKSGKLVQLEGLDTETGTFLLPLYPNLRIPVAPTVGQAAEAGRWLGHDFLGDFPFSQEFHRTHAVSALLQPFVMPYIDDQAPMVAVSATTMGTGKTRLCRVLSYVSDARGADLVTENMNPQHFESAVFSVLRSSPTSVLLDNVKSDLDHAWLQGLLSTPEMKYRLMATNTVVSVRNPALWLVSANNPNWQRETRRRILPVDLDPQMENPWARRAEDFRIPDIERFAQSSRQAILERIYTIIQFWLSSGAPRSSDFSGSFERWAPIMGGLLQAAGLQGFLQHMSDAEADLDHEVLEWRALLEHWWLRRTQKDTWIPPKEVMGMALSEELLVELLGDKSPGSQATAMGRALTRNLRRVFGDYRIQRQKGRKGWLYSVERIDRGEDKGPDPGPQGPDGGQNVDKVPTLPTTCRPYTSIRSAQNNGVDTGIAAECRPCRPQTLLHAHAREFPEPESDQNKVGKVGKVGRVERKLGEIRKKIGDRDLKAIQMALAMRRAAYSNRDGEFGSPNPRWGPSVRSLIESGAWIPPNDLPWDRTLQVGPPPGWVFAGQAEPTRASPAPEESLSDCLDRVLL